jgi:hypothetical protein
VAYEECLFPAGMRMFAGRTAVSTGSARACDIRRQKSASAAAANDESFEDGLELCMTHPFVTAWEGEANGG